MVSAQNLDALNPGIICRLKQAQEHFPQEVQKLRPCVFWAFLMFVGLNIRSLIVINVTF